MAKGWSVTKNIRTRTRRMIASLEDRGVSHEEIAQKVGVSTNAIKGWSRGFGGFGRDKYEALRDMYRIGVSDQYVEQHTAIMDADALPVIPKTKPSTGGSNGTPTQYVAEALADLDQAQLLFSSAERRLHLARVRAEEMASKIREVGLN